MIFQWLAFIKQYKIPIIIVFSAFFILQACTVTPDEEVLSFVKNVQNEKKGKIEPLPSYQKFKPFKYTAINLRSPFEPPSIAKSKKPATLKKGTPEMNRPRELLESYPLDSLKFVGTIERGGKYWALIKDPHGIIHRVGIGNYMGENYGRIEKIDATSIDIRELILNEEGEYENRPITIRLHEQT